MELEFEQWQEIGGFIKESTALMTRKCTHCFNHNIERQWSTFLASQWETAHFCLKKSHVSAHMIPF